MVVGAFVLWIPGMAFNILQTLNVCALSRNNHLESLSRRDTDQSKSSKNDKHNSERVLGTVSEEMSDPEGFGTRSASLKNPGYSSSSRSPFINPHGS